MATSAALTRSMSARLAASRSAGRQGVDVEAAVARGPADRTRSAASAALRARSVDDDGMVTTSETELGRALTSTRASGPALAWAAACMAGKALSRPTHHPGSGEVTSRATRVRGDVDGTATMAAPFLATPRSRGGVTEVVSRGASGGESEGEGAVGGDDADDTTTARDHTTTRAHMAAAYRPTAVGGWMDQKLANLRRRLLRYEAWHDPEHTPTPAASRPPDAKAADPRWTVKSARPPARVAKRPAERGPPRHQPSHGRFAWCS
jgi:hypothetical protein